MRSKYVNSWIHHSGRYEYCYVEIAYEKFPSSLIMQNRVSCYVRSATVSIINIPAGGLLPSFLFVILRGTTYSGLIKASRKINLWEKQRRMKKQRKPI